MSDPDSHQRNPPSGSGPAAGLLADRGRGGRGPGAADRRPQLLGEPSQHAEEAATAQAQAQTRAATPSSTWAGRQGRAFRQPAPLRSARPSSRNATGSSGHLDQPMEITAERPRIEADWIAGGVKHALDDGHALGTAKRASRGRRDDLRGGRRQRTDVRLSARRAWSAAAWRPPDPADGPCADAPDCGDPATAASPLAAASGLASSSYSWPRRDPSIAAAWRRRAGFG